MAWEYPLGYLACLLNPLHERLAVEERFLPFLSVRIDESPRGFERRFMLSPECDEPDLLILPFRVIEVFRLDRPADFTAMSNQSFQRWEFPV